MVSELCIDKNDHSERLFAFAVISDTHVNPDELSCNSPFPVNARANARFRRVIADLNQREIDFVVHLGDLVHPVPDTQAYYKRAATAFKNIAADLRFPMYVVPGNHDIGDTPVQGGPAAPTTGSMIKTWTKEFGAQYQSFSHKGVTFVTFNAQLLNSGLAEEAEQRKWIERQLKVSKGRIMLMYHHPAYLCAPDESSHYDNTNQPARQWLLELTKTFQIEAMFSGHAHNFWYDRYGETDYYLAPATSFVRQDYSEMFRVPPTGYSEYGRDDRAKLGYFIVTVYSDGHSVQIARTNGVELGPKQPAAPAARLANPPKRNAHPKLGFDLRTNWSELTEVAPSGALDEFERKCVRNDYPLLALIEMGIRDIRVPMNDLRNARHRSRLIKLCHLGFRPTLFSFGAPSSEEIELIVSLEPYLHDWEITIDWEKRANLVGSLMSASTRTGLPIYLSRLRSKRDLPEGSVFYHVVNHGFLPSETVELDELTHLFGNAVKGAVFRLGQDQDVLTFLKAVENVSTTKALHASVHLRCAGENPALASLDRKALDVRIKDVLSIIHKLSATRVFCDSLIDVDRGYFPRAGVIDRLGNPTFIANRIAAAHT